MNGLAFKLNRSKQGIPKGSKLAPYAWNCHAWFSSLLSQQIPVVVQITFAVLSKS